MTEFYELIRVQQPHDGSRIQQSWSIGRIRWLKSRSSAEVPELDFSKAEIDEGDLELAKKMVDAVTNCGFFNGVSIELIEEVKSF